ncbi:MAG: AAA family ATPase [Lachnospiraceae bacterium]|nr:AAA family ATPase [Lachnospiraceae bacterium]
MNIKQAKEHIKNSVKLYLKKDEYGEYRIPVVRQRPIFLLGSPGIGKTAIMEQIAQELGIALVSYSMTHHTRQSALGLPFITHKNYKGLEFDISEYTMSEIIASVYEVMEQSGIEEGILFLDEINCVSETLAPSMLQFLQYKVFGRHRVPDGWVIVTAGNPPEYNKSVREFDVVTMDRMKLVEVEADYATWKEYALRQGIHNAVTTYLDMKKNDFYRVETNVGGKSYVTARGWEDLSATMLLCEEEGLGVDETLVAQYLHNEKIVKEFTAYYELYNKYKKDYKVEEILAGTNSAQVVERARIAKFDERLSLLGMLLDKLESEMKENLEKSDFLTDLMKLLKRIRTLHGKDSAAPVQSLIEDQIANREKIIASMTNAGTLSGEDKRRHRAVIRFLEHAARRLRLENPDADAAFALLKADFDAEVAHMKEENQSVQTRLHNLFAFSEVAFMDGNEVLVLVTELTVNAHSARFIGLYGSADYQRHNADLMLHERQDDIMKELNSMELDSLELHSMENEASGL